MPESMERSSGSRSETARPLTIILGPVETDGRRLLALFCRDFEFLPFFLLMAFFCLGMALLQQRRDSSQKLFDLDRLVQHSNIIGLCVLSSFRTCISREQD